MNEFWKHVQELDSAIGLFLLASLGGLIMWAKKQTIDNVYATKQELHETREELEEKLDKHEAADVARYNELQHTIAYNHSEMKTLIIEQLGNKK